MILRLVLCFWLFCYVYCESWDEKESVVSAEREISSDGDLTRTNEGNGGTTFKMPEILINGQPQKVIENKGGECISELSVKKIVKDVLKYVKKNPEALDLMIDEYESESVEEAQTENKLRSLQAAGDTSCPLAIVRYLKQIPKFLMQLRKYPECLLAIFGCHQKFEVSSTSSNLCEKLPQILNMNKIPRPDAESTHDFDFHAPEVSFESLEPNVQIPFDLQESTESESEPGVQQYFIVPQYIPKEEIPTNVIEPFEHQSSFPINLEQINDTYPKPIHIEDTEPFNKFKTIYYKHHKILPLSPVNGPKPIQESESKSSEDQGTDKSSPIYDIEYDSREVVEDTFRDDIKENLKPVGYPKLIYDEVLKPGHNTASIHEPEAIYVEELNHISADESIYQKPIPIQIKEPKPIVIQEDEPIYVEDTEPVNKGSNIEKPIPIHQSEAELSPTYVEDIYPDDVKDKPKPIHVERPELIHVEEFKPNSQSIVIKKPVPVNLEKLYHISVDDQELLPFYVKEPKSVTIQESEPIYSEEVGTVIKPIHFAGPKPINHQYTVDSDDATPIYETEFSPTNIEDVYPDDVKENPKPINVDHPEDIYSEESKPNNKPTKIQKPLPIHWKKPKPIAIQITKPIYVDEEPFNGPVYIQEPKPIYYQYPVYFDESTSDSKIVHNPTYIEDINHDNDEEKPKAIYVENPELLYAGDEIKPQNPIPIHINEPQSLSTHEPEPIYSEEGGHVMKPIYVAGPKHINHQQPVYSDEATPIYGTENSPAYVEDIFPNDENTKPIYVEHSEQIYDEELKPDIESIYINEPKPIHVVNTEPNNIKKVVPVQIPINEIQPGYVDYSIPNHEKEYFNEGLRPTDSEAPNLIYINNLKPIFVENPEELSNHEPETFYIEKPEIIYTDEIKSEPTYVEEESDIEYPEELSSNFKGKPQSIVKQQGPIKGPIPDYYDQFDTYFEKPQHIDYQDQDIVYPEEPEHSKPLYAQAPEISFFKKPISIENIKSIYMPQTPKEQLSQPVFIQVLPSNVEKQIIQLIGHNPEKLDINKIIEVLHENQHAIKPRLYKILFSVLNALIRGIVDPKLFNEIVKYLIQPRINSEWNDKKTQTLYYLLLPGKTGQVEASTLDVINGLIHQPENTSNNPQFLDLIFPLLIKIKTGPVDYRINDVVLALLNRNKKYIFSDEEVETLLTFIQPNKMGYIPKQRVVIASMLVNFDKIPYFSRDNLKTIFLLMAKNKRGKIDPRAIQILKEILLPKKNSFLSEQNIIDILVFLGKDSGELIHPKRLDLALFLLKNKPQAPILIDYFIKNLKDYDIIHSKFIDIILYLHKNNMLPYKLLETLVSLISQDKSEHIDSKTFNNLLLLLKPYKISRPKVVLKVYHILNSETLSTPNVDVSTHPHDLQVLMYYLKNPGSKHLNPTLNKKYTHLELENLLSRVFKSESVQNNEFLPDLLKHNNGHVELTYLLNDQKPVLYNPVYYVKYNIPVKVFLKKIQDIIRNNPELSKDPPRLLRELTLAGSVSGVSPNLNGFQNEELLKITFEDGKLIQAKVLDDKKLNLNDQIKLIQDLNSNTNPQDILQQNEINAAKYYTSYRENLPNLEGTANILHGGIVGSLDGIRPIVMSFNRNNLRKIETADEPERTSNFTQPLHTDSESDVNPKNETERHQQNEN